MRQLIVATATAAALTVAACSASGDTGAGTSSPLDSHGDPSLTAIEPAPLAVSSNDFGDGGEFADSMTSSAFAYCDGPGHNPDLEWTNGPEGTKTFAIHFVDVTEEDYTFWLKYDIPRTTTSVETNGARHTGGTEGRNSVGLNYYIGPCPEWDDERQYQLTIYALDIEIGTRGITPHDFAELSQGHVLDQVTITATRTGPPRP